MIMMVLICMLLALICIIFTITFNINKSIFGYELLDVQCFKFWQNVYSSISSIMILTLFDSTLTTICPILCCIIPLVSLLTSETRLINLKVIVEKAEKSDILSIDKKK